MRKANRLWWVSGVVAAAASAAGAQTTLEDYLRAVEDARAGLAEACENLPADAPEGRVWLRAGPQGVEIAPADPQAAAAAAFWAEAALGARAAASALYGAAATETLAVPVMIETTAKGVIVHDGAAMSAGAPCDAVARMTAALGGAPGSDPFDAARDAATAPERTAVPIGGTGAIELSEPAPAGAIARGPDGVLAAISEDGVTIDVEARRGADAGDGDVRIYAPDNPFTPVATAPIRVLPGAAPAESDGPEALQLGGRREGVAPIGEARAFVIEVQEGGRYQFASDGPGDFTGELRSAGGALIASDDDSGKGYGFVIEAALEPGEYTLNLSHCCGGGGRFAVSASSE